MTSALNGRVSRLEAAAAPVAEAPVCGECRLLHVPQPMVSIKLLQQCLGVLPGPLPKFCLCDCCEGSRWIARRSHGLSDEEHTA
jgi:hypothetical protein